MLPKLIYLDAVAYVQRVPCHDLDKYFTRLTIVEMRIEEVIDYLK